MIDFVPENFRGIGRDLVENATAIVRRVFDGSIGATNQNGRDTNGKQFSSEHAHASK